MSAYRTQTRGVSPSATLAGQSAFFLAGNVFTLVVGFPFQIYLANHLGPEGLGAFGLYESSIAVIAGLLSFGLAPTAVKFIPHFLANNAFSKIRDFLRLSIKFLIKVGISGYLIMLLISVAVPFACPQYTEILEPFSVMGLMFPLGLWLFFTTQSLRGYHEIRYMVIGSSFLQLSAKVLFSVVLFSLGFKLMGYIWAVVLSTALALAWMLKGLKEQNSKMPVETPVEEFPDAELSWRKYAKVMYGNSLLSTFTAPADRFLVGLFLGVSGVGVLMTIKVLQQLPGIFLQMFLAVVAPMFSAANARGDFNSIQKLYCITTDWLIRLALPLLVFLAIFAGPVLGLYGETFQSEGVLPLYILLFAQLINLGCGPIGNVLNMSGYERVMFKLSIFQSGLLIVGLAVLTPLYGLGGSSFAILLAVLFNNFSGMYFAIKKLSLHWWDRRYILWIIPFSGSVVTCFVLLKVVKDIGKIELLSFLICSYAVFHILHFAFGVNEDDREVVREFRKKFKKLFRKRANECA